MKSIERRLVPDLASVAKEADDSVRLRAISLIGEMADLDDRINKTEGYRTQINYEYWQTLALAEQEERTVTARRLIYEAEEANAQAELDKAIKLYEQAFAIWAEIFDDYPILTIDDSAEDLFDSIRRYMVAIDSQDLPENFPLATFAQMMGREGTVDSKRYQELRESQKLKAEQRQKELEEEERRREEEAAKEEAKAEAAKKQQPKESKEKAAKQNAKEKAAEPKC